LRAGNRLRLTIEAPSQKPELWGFQPMPGPAVNTVFTDSAHPSSLALPLVAVAAGTTFPAERSCGAVRNQPCRSAVFQSPSVPEFPAPGAVLLVLVIGLGATGLWKRRKIVGVRSRAQ
jgi:hypothetical protein